jgi:hypothetical protein
MSAGDPEAEAVLAKAAFRPPVGAPRLLFPDQNLPEIRRNIHLINELPLNPEFSFLPAKPQDTLPKRPLFREIGLIITRKHP